MPANTARNLVTISGFLCYLLCGSLILPAAGASGEGSPASPQTPSAAAAKPDLQASGAGVSSRASLWTGGIGDGLRKGARQAGLVLGPGFGTHALGSKRKHDLALTAVQYSRVMSDLIGGDRWYRGNAELVYELFGGSQYEPSRRTVVGLVPLVRYTFATGGRWVPFVNGGVGFAYTTISDPDLNGGMEFNVQVGAGWHYFLSNERALTFQYRWFHLSNAGLRSPNSGVNTHLVFTGLSWLF